MFTQISRRSLSVTPNYRTKLIKFRYGLAKIQKVQPSVSSTSNQTVKQAQGEAIWDFELPLRFRRKALDDQEMAVINNGGPL